MDTSKAAGDDGDATEMAGLKGCVFSRRSFSVYTEMSAFVKSKRVSGESTVPVSDLYNMLATT
jgi:hypothetical protein